VVPIDACVTAGLRVPGVRAGSGSPGRRSLAETLAGGIGVGVGVGLAVAALTALVATGAGDVLVADGAHPARRVATPTTRAVQVRRFMCALGIGVDVGAFDVGVAVPAGGL
jgi:hypothetical protein